MVSRCSVFYAYYFLLLEKLCKSNMDSWDCYNCESAHSQSANQPMKSQSSHSDEECCSTSKRRKSTKSLSSQSSTEDKKKTAPSWRPLLLFIPLRLGLSETNPAYYPSLKVSPSCTTWSSNKKQQATISGAPPLNVVDIVDMLTL